MRGREIEDYIRKHSAIIPYFRGVHTLQSLPPKLDQETFVIVNTLSERALCDGSSLPGHWFVIGRCRGKSYEVFDPLGTHKNYFRRFVPYTGTFLFNTTQVQPDESTSCAAFCLYFVFHRVMNFDLPLQSLLFFIFHETNEINEAEVKKFFKDFSK